MVTHPWRELTAREPATYDALTADRRSNPMKPLPILVSLVALQGVALADTPVGGTDIGLGEDSQPNAFDANNPAFGVNPISIIQGDGVKIGEGTSLYPQVGLETGYVSNVFYQSSNPIGAGLMRLIVEVGAGSLSMSPARSAVSPEEEATTPNDKGDFLYSANLYATYDQYLSGNDAVTSQGGLGLGAYLRGAVNPGKPLSFLVINNFDRIIRATNFESQHDTNRDINNLTLQLSYAPAGRSLSGSIHLQNTIDIFEESDQGFADRMLTAVGARLNYKFLPLTLVYADVTGDANTGLGNSSTKVTSYPLVAVLGINTAITLETSIIGRIGYTEGFFSSGPDYATITGGLYVEHRYPLGKFDLMYSYDHSDSINANFYRDHLVQAWVEQRFAPFTVFASPMLRLREYEGLVVAPMATGSASVRDDVIFAAWAGMRYQFRNWIMASLEYRLTIDETSFRYMVDGSTQDPSYIRHELLLGVRAAY